MKTNVPFRQSLNAFARPLAVSASLLAAIAFTSVTLAAGNADQPPKPAYGAVYAFGDSLSDTGRTASVVGNVFPIVNGRFSNGPVWIEYVSPYLRVPYDAVNNFSWGGAYTGRGNTFTRLPGMLDELDEFLAPYGARSHIDKDALYVVSGGANEFLRILNGSVDPSQIIPAAVQNIKTIVTTLHERGAKHVVVMNLPDVGLSPLARSLGPVVAGQATQASIYFNTLLSSALDSLDFTVVRVNTFAVLHTVVANPAQYGFTNTTGMGITDIANSGTYVFWDGTHPTTRAHAILANEILHSLSLAVGEEGLAWRGAQGFF